MITSDYTILLLSASPRRKQLVQQMGFSLRVQPTNIKEDYPVTLPWNKIPEYLSIQKAESFAIENLRDNEILLACDTMVFSNGKALGKPKNRAAAIKYLSSLSDSEHTVISGTTLKTKEKRVSFSVATTVKFAPLSSEEINYYIDNYSPYDKAGAYGIQEWIGLIGVEKIDGNFYNVMGLPTQEIFQQIRNL